MLKETLYEQMKQAMKDRNAERLETLRFLISEIKRVEIDEGELSDEQVVKLLQKEVKRRRDAVEQFTSAGREELAAEELKKMAIIEEFLPEQMSKEEVAAVIDEVMEEGDAFGDVMRKTMANVGSKADGKMVSEVVREKLQ